MFDPSDTIVAIATPPGRGGIGVVRLSGPDAARVAGILTNSETPLEARRATLARVAGRCGAIDQVLVTSFPAPHSYTGEDVVEISAHGSPVLLHQIVDSAMAAGARAAEPGEFTLRAFLNGRIDLVQAEAVGDLIDAVTPAQARAAFDQLEGTLTARIRSIEEMLFDLTAKLEASLDFPAEGYHFIDHATAGDELETICSAIAVER
jgi:tRNA modification GTPase